MVFRESFQSLKQSLLKQIEADGTRVFQLGATVSASLRTLFTYVFCTGLAAMAPFYKLFTDSYSWPFDAAFYDSMKVGPCCVVLCCVVLCCVVSG